MHPCLWDASAAAYINVNMRRRALCTIATKLHVWPTKRGLGAVGVDLYDS